ncbi:MAG: hypothetical protein ACTSVV_05685, partial [Promethearchaeota archaeon]
EYIENSNSESDSVPILKHHVSQSNSESDSVPILKQHVSQLEGLLQECEKKYEELDATLTQVLNQLNMDAISPMLYEENGKLKLNLE